MPHSSGKKKYSPSELKRIQSEVAARYVGSTVKKESKRARLKERARVDDFFNKSRGGSTQKPPQNTQPKGFIEGITSGRDRLLKALTPEEKKRGRR